MSRMSPFFKPTPQKSPCFRSFRAFVYWTLTCVQLIALITTPWLIDLTRDLYMQSTPRYAPVVANSWVYSTVAGMLVACSCILSLGALFVHLKSYRLCITFAVVSLFAPILLLSSWQHVYVDVAIAVHIILGVLFGAYAIVVIQYEAKVERSLNGNGSASNI